MESCIDKTALKSTHHYPIRCITADGASNNTIAAIPTECTVAVYLNKQEWKHIVCSPSHLSEMVVGRLYVDGVISSAAEIERIDVLPSSTNRNDNSATQFSVHVVTNSAQTIPSNSANPKDGSNQKSPGKHTAAPAITPIPWKPEWIFSLARTFKADTPGHKATFGLHSCYLAYKDTVLFCCEDVSRHNAFDKVIGCALADSVDLSRCILFSSGRMPEDMITKAVAARIPVLVTKAVPTERGISVAQKENITLICSAHPDSMKVYNDPQNQPQLPTGTVRALCISRRKGTPKTPVESGEVTVTKNWGIVEDAHGGTWHRQVSMLAWESITRAQSWGLDVAEGSFAENITSEGIDLLALPMGTQVRIGTVLLELSQIGKACHTRCAIYHLCGDCIFPREGVFFVVLEEGTMHVGDTIEVVKIGDGTCAFTPPEALEELRAWQEEQEKERLALEKRLNQTDSTVRPLS